MAEEGIRSSRYAAAIHTPGPLKRNHHGCDGEVDAQGKIPHVLCTNSQPPHVGFPHKLQLMTMPHVSHRSEAPHSVFRRLVCTAARFDPVLIPSTQSRTYRVNLVALPG